MCSTASSKSSASVTISFYISAFYLAHPMSNSTNIGPIFLQRQADLRLQFSSAWNYVVFRLKFRTKMNNVPVPLL